MSRCLPALLSFHRSPRSARPGSRRRGVGIIDCLVSIVVISLSSFGFLAASMSSSRLEVETRAVSVAVELTRDVLEELQATPLDEVLARWNDDPADDPDGWGTSRGGAFELDTTRAVQETAAVVGSLLRGGTQAVEETVEVATRATATQEDGSCAVPETMECQVLMPTWTDGGGALQLTEDSKLPEFGLPADLNGDGKIDSENRVADFHVLPVVIRMEWPTADGGVRTLDFAAVLGGRTGK